MEIDLNIEGIKGKREEEALDNALKLEGNLNYNNSSFFQLQEYMKQYKDFSAAQARATSMKANHGYTRDQMIFILNILDSIKKAAENGHLNVIIDSKMESDKDKIKKFFTDKNYLIYWFTVPTQSSSKSRIYISWDLTATPQSIKEIIRNNYGGWMF